MNKQSFITILLTVLMSMTGAKAFAYIEVKNADGVTIYYAGESGTKLTVVGLAEIMDYGYFWDYFDDHSYLWYSGNVVIPESVEYNGKKYRVTSISDDAFHCCSGLTSVTIPNSVTSIGDWAFGECSGLTSVTIPNSVTSIGDYAFSYCSSLTSVTIPNSVTSVGQYAFSPTAWFNNQPNGLVYAGKVAYEYKGDMPENTSIIIEDGTKGIAGSAFSGCSGLTSVTIPSSVTDIGNWAFSGCSGLTSIQVESGNQKYDSRNNCNAIIETSSNKLIFGCKNTIIPNSVTSIGNDAFYGCSGLTSVIIPNSVTSIGNDAFYGCSGLISIFSEIEDPFAIHDSVFEGIPSNTTLIVPRDKASIYKSTAGWKKITKIVELSGKCGDNVYYSYDRVTHTLTISGEGGIWGWDFMMDGADFRPWHSYNREIRSIIIEPGVTSIGMSAFEACGVTSVTIPSSVTVISDRSFFCSSLTSVIIPNGVIKIGYDDDWGGAFEGCSSMTSVTIPSSVTSITDHAFKGCSGLTSIMVESGNEFYDSRNDCNAIIETSSNKLILGCKHTIIPSSVTSIGDYAFSYCSGLTSVTIPNSVTSIGYYAFKDCSGLTSVTIPNGVTSIGSDAFYGTAWYNNQPDGLVYAGKVAYKYKGEMPDNTSISLKDGTVGITSDAFQGCSGLTSITIPNSVTSIGGGAFRDCSGLTSVTIPNSVTSIDEYAFRGCSGLTSITIPNSVTSIGSDAFRDCSGLRSVTIPNSVTSIGYYAFNNCNSLTSVTIPSSVTSISDYAFAGCSSLTSILSLNNTPSTNGTHIFNNVNKENCVLWVPIGSVSAYKTAGGWKDFKNIRGIIDGDVNLDVEVNQADLDATVDFIMGKDPEGFYESLADLNGDDVVDAADVVKLVTILNLQEGLNMDYQAKYSNQVISSLSCTLNNDGDKAIQLTKCELYCNHSVVSSSKFKVTLAKGESKKCSFDELESLSSITGFSVVWYYTYNGEDYTYRCEIEE